MLTHLKKGWLNAFKVEIFGEEPSGADNTDSVPAEEGTEVLSDTEAEEDSEEMQEPLTMA